MPATRHSTSHRDLTTTIPRHCFSGAICLISVSEKYDYILTTHSPCLDNSILAHLPRIIRLVSTRLRRQQIMASATTPYRTDMTSQHTPSKTPSRRALGDLTPRALNSPASQTKNVLSAEAIRARSPLKKVTSHIPNTFADKENLLASPNVASQGKKRGIEEVDSAETIENAKMLAHAREEGAWGTGVRLTTEAVQRHTVHSSCFLRVSSTELIDVGEQSCWPCRSWLAH